MKIPALCTPDERELFRSLRDYEPADALSVLGNAVCAGDLVTIRAEAVGDLCRMNGWRLPEWAI